MDNIDVKPASVTTSQYRAWYEGLARRNLGHVKAGTVGRLHKYPKELGVWHIQTVVDTYPVAREMLAELGYTSFDTGVDIGVGTVTFFDFVPARRRVLLDIVHEYCKFMGEAIQADAEALPLPSALADIVVCSDILEHVLSFDAALSEARRILKPGGLLLVCVPWMQELSGVLSDFAHVRTFDEDNMKARFQKMNVLASRIIPKNKYGWIGQIVAVMQ